MDEKLSRVVIYHDAVPEVGENIPQGVVSVEKKYGTAGKHVICDMYGVRRDRKDLSETAYLLEACIEASTMSGNVVLDYVEHRFEPQGASVVLLLAESHLSVHTYPEHGYVSADIYSCGGNSEPEKGVEYLISVFKPERYNTVTLQRGTGGSCTDIIKSVG